MNAVQKAFDQLSAMALDMTMSERQITETRRAFFAGVAWMNSEFGRLSGFVDDPDGSKMLDALAAINEECRQFGKDIEAGKK